MKERVFAIGMATTRASAPIACSGTSSARTSDELDILRIIVRLGVQHPLTRRAPAAMCARKESGSEGHS